MTRHTQEAEHSTVLGLAPSDILNDRSRAFRLNDAFVLGSALDAFADLDHNDTSPHVELVWFAARLLEPVLSRRAKGPELMYRALAAAAVLGHASARVSDLLGLEEQRDEFLDALNLHVDSALH